MSAEPQPVETSPADARSLETLGKRASAIKALLALVAFLVAGGASSVMWLSRYALAAEVAKHDADTATRLAAIERQAAHAETRITVLERVLGSVEQELFWQRSQAIETARRVGAKVVPPPSKNRE
jgi:hypothetical protein